MMQKMLFDPSGVYHGGPAFVRPYLASSSNQLNIDVFMTFYSQILKSSIDKIDDNCYQIFTY